MSHDSIVHRNRVLTLKKKLFLPVYVTETLVWQESIKTRYDN